MTVKLLHSSARSSTSAAAIALGAGSRSSSTPPSDVRLPAADDGEQHEQRPHARSSSSARARSATSSGSSRRRGRATPTSSVASDAAGPLRQDDDAVGEHDRLLDVVRHEHDRARIGVQRRGEPVLHLQARQRVERGERLVEAEHRPAGEQRARERDALAHPARQLVRPGVLEALEAEVLQQRGGALACRGAIEARDAQRERGVVGGARPRQQQVALRHERGGLRLDGARVGRDEPADELEQRRLAAAARPDDGDDLARADVQRDLVERGDRRGAAAAGAKVFDTPIQAHGIDVDLSRRRLRGRLSPRLHRSLRGHYPTGSKGRRRGAGRPLSRPAASPPG